MHRGVREAPERVCFVRQKVGGDQGIFAGPDDFPAERAVSPASFNPLHTCKMAPNASRSVPRVLAGPQQVPIACQTAEAGQQGMSLAAGHEPDPGRLLLIAILTGGWNGSTCIAVVAALGDGTELLRCATHLKLFHQDDGALIRGLYPCPQDSCFDRERLKIDSKGAGGPSELAPALLCIGDRGNQGPGNQQRDQTHVTLTGTEAGQRPTRALENQG